MTMHFQLTLDNVRQLHREHEFFTSRCFADPTPSYVFWYVAMPVTVVMIAIISDSFATSILACGIIWGAGSITARWYRAKYAKNYYTNDNFAGSLIPFQLELLGDRLILSNKDLIHHHFWHSFRFLRESAEYFHLFFSPICCMSVPKSAFRSEAELESFRAAIKLHEPATR